MSGLLKKLRAKYEENCRLFEVGNELFIREARITAETVCLYVLKSIDVKVKTNASLEQLIQLLAENKLITRPIRNHLTTIRDFGNLCAHHHEEEHDVTHEDAQNVYNSLKRVVDWASSKITEMELPSLKNENTTLKSSKKNMKKSWKKPSVPPSVKSKQTQKGGKNTMDNTKRLEGETLETIRTGIITFKKGSASDIFTRFAALYGSNKERIMAGMQEAYRRKIITADPVKKWAKMNRIIRDLCNKGYKLPQVGSFEEALG